MTSYPLSYVEDEREGADKLVTIANPSDNGAIYSIGHNVWNSNKCFR